MVDPATKFLGVGAQQGDFFAPSTAAENVQLEYFTTFLDTKNHAVGVPLAAAIDSHFYAMDFPGYPINRTVPATYSNMFGQADIFSVAVRQIDAVRRRLSPSTKVFLKVNKSCIYQIR